MATDREDTNSAAAEHLAMIRASAFFDAQWYLRRNPDVARSGVDPAPAHALDDRLIGHVDLQHQVELDICGLHRVGLRDRSREAVEQEAVGAIALGDTLLDQADDDLVADQTSSVHHLLGGQAHRGAGFDGGGVLSGIKVEF